MAVEHLLLTTDRDRGLQLVSQLFLPTLLAGQLSTVQRWLSTLGDSAIETCPPLAVLATWMAVYSGQTAVAQRWATFVDDASCDLAPPDGSASFDASRAMLRAVMCPDGPERMLADAGIAVAQEPPWSPWRDTALNMCAEAHLLNGDADRATVLFAEGSLVSAALSSTDPRVFGESEQAFLAISCGQWAEAGKHVEVALAIIEQHQLHDYPAAALAFAAAGRVAIHEGQRDSADRHLTAAMRVRPLLTHLLPFAAVRGAIAPRQGLRGDRRSDGRASTSCARSTRSCSIVRLSAPSSTKSKRSAGATTRAPRQGSPVRHHSHRPNYACCRTCRPTSPPATLPSGCSCRSTPSTHNSGRCTGSSACRRAAKPSTRRRRSGSSPGSTITGWRRARTPHSCRTRAPSPTWAPPRRHTATRRSG